MHISGLLGFRGGRYLAYWAPSKILQNVKRYAILENIYRRFETIVRYHSYISV